MSAGAPDPEGRTALVSGASAGIGAALVRALVRRGFPRVVGVARRGDRLDALRAELGPCFVPRVADLSAPADIAALVAAEPRVDVLVNNAGAGWSGPFDEQARQDPGRLLAMVDLNCRALLHLSAAWVPGMVERGAGWVLDVGSIAGLAPAPGSAVYGATKAFVNQHCEALRMELRPKGVRVCLLTPGPVPSEFFDVARPGAPRPPAALFVPTARVAEEALVALFADRPRVSPGRRTALIAAALRGAPLPLLRHLGAARAARP